MMKSKTPEVLELEAELTRLTTLVRARRKQLARLRTCPNSDCECRQVWKQVVEKTLARQMGKIRSQIRPKASGRTKLARTGRSSK